MDDKDYLIEILGKIDQVNEPIDLEGSILNALQIEENSKAQIARYKAKGFTALIVSGILIVILGLLFSLPSRVRSVEHTIITYTSITVILLVLFFQLETGRTKIFTILKNNKS